MGTSSYIHTMHAICIHIMHTTLVHTMHAICIHIMHTTRVRAYIYSRTRYAIRAYIILIDTKVQLYLQLYAKYIILLASMHN